MENIDQCTKQRNNHRLLLILEKLQMNRQSHIQVFQAILIHYLYCLLAMRTPPNQRNSSSYTTNDQICAFESYLSLQDRQGVFFKTMCNRAMEATTRRQERAIMCCPLSLCHGVYFYCLTVSGRGETTGMGHHQFRKI